MPSSENILVAGEREDHVRRNLPGETGGEVRAAIANEAAIGVNAVDLAVVE